MGGGAGGRESSWGKKGRGGGGLNDEYWTEEDRYILGGGRRSGMRNEEKKMRRREARIFPSRPFPHTRTRERKTKFPDENDSLQSFGLRRPPVGNVLNDAVLARFVGVYPPPGEY